MARSPVLPAALTCILAAGISLAQPASSDPRPLRPGDTSSPRDTLRDFLANAGEMADIYRREGADAAIASLARTRALDALDLSGAEYRSIDAHQQAPYPILLLHEILNRIPVPPDDKIPGDEDVASAGIERWRVPDTRIAIGRVPSGPRAGEYLFTAETVSRLETDYAQVAHLPLRPGVTPGVYESVRRDELAGVTREVRIRDRLKPIDASSPRAALRGFLENVDRAYALAREADAALAANPPTMSREEAREVERSVESLLEGAVKLLDLSEVPEAHRDDAGLELALALKEVLDRVGVPPWNTVPDSLAVEEAARRLGDNAPPFRWTIPNTEIELVEAGEGERSGRFQFSVQTVGRIGEFYDSVRDLPYRPGASVGIYEYYVSTPGYLVAHASLLGRLVDALPGGLKVTVHGQTLWQWIGLAVCVLGVTLAGVVVTRLGSRLARRSRTPYNHMARLLVPVTIAVLTWATRNVVDESLNITGDVLEAVTAGADLIVYAAIGWAVFDLLRASADLLAASRRFSDALIDPQLVRLGGRALGFLLAAWVVIGGMRSLGADVVPLLAGLGIGGLAVALAAQTTLANLLGSVTLLTNKPVRVGEFCSYGEQLGTIEEIGLHSTRIRTLDRTVVSVPNADFVQMKLENLSRRDARLLTKVLHLRPETTPEELCSVLTGLRALLAAHPQVEAEDARVSFVDYGRGSKDVEVFAYLRCVEEDEFMAVQEDLLLRMGEVVTAAGTGFAFWRGPWLADGHLDPWDADPG